MTLTLNPDQPLSAQLAALEDQAGRVQQIQQDVDHLTDQIESLRDRRQTRLTELSEAMKAQKLLALTREHVTAALTGHHAPDVTVPAPAETQPAATEPDASSNVVTPPAGEAAAIDEPVPAPSVRDIVLRDVAAHPGTTSAACIERINLHKSRVQPVFSQLRQGGYLRIENPDIPFKYHVTDAGRQRLAAPTGTEGTPGTTEAPEPDPEDSSPVLQTEPPAAGVVTAAPPAQLNVNSPPARPRPGSNLARLLDVLEQGGPATAADLAQSTGIHLKEVERTAANLLARNLVEYRGMYAPSVYQVPGDPRPYEPSRVVASGRQIPQEELRAALMKYRAAVLKVMKPGREYTESEILKATGLAISHLRRALADLIDESAVRRLEGPNQAVRATYSLDTFEYKSPSRQHLSPNDRRVLEHLHATTTRGGRESITGLADRLRLTREDVQAGLAMLHARHWLKWTRVGALALYSLTTTGMTRSKDAA